MTRVRTIGAVAGAAALACAVQAAEGDFFPFAIPGDDAAPTATDFSGLNGGPIGPGDLVAIRDGHLQNARGRLRIWGMNVCFGANVPSHEDAAKVAAHLAKLGINGIRFHHHETSEAPRGLIARGTGAIDPDMLERQDYFLDQLHRHGIYADLNLHVGRMGGVRDELPYECRYDKYVLYFMPDLRAKLKDFCRAYLDHTNPYRKLRRADDPGVAIVEITNENAFQTRGPSLAAKLPEPYRGEFVRQWNAWLRTTYGTTARLKAVWKTDGEAPGEVIATLKADAADPKNWSVHQTREAPVTLVFNEPGPRPDLPAVRLDLQQASAAVHMSELTRRGLMLTKGRGYTLRFWVRAEKPRKLHADVSQNGPDNWGSVGVVETLDIGPTWQEIVRPFRCSEAPAAGARLCFKFGGDATDLWLAGVSLREGAEGVGLGEGQTIEAGTVGIPGAGWPEAAMVDAKRFMVDVEKDFIRDMTGFLKKDLGVKMPVTASQITYHGAGIVAETCEFVDIHAYWQHPSFPGKPWDPRNWTIRNTPMEWEPGRDPLSERATWRIFGRPYTMSEWNIPAPHDMAASVVPFAALTAALQDWDGVFFFDYASANDAWYRDSLTGYFSFVGHPAKLALLGACANLYRRGDLAPLRERAAGTLEDRVSGGLALSRLIGIDPAAAKKDPAVAAPGALRSPGDTAVWDATDRAKARVCVNAPATRAVWGLIAGQEIELGGLRLKIGPTERDYAAIVATSLDGAPLESSRRMLLVAVGTAANTGMAWNETRTSVGNQWGKGPSRANGIAADVAWPGGKIREVRALDSTGAPAGAVAVGAGERFAIGPASRTLWYEVVR